MTAIRYIGPASQRSAGQNLLFSAPPRGRYRVPASSGRPAATSARQRSAVPLEAPVRVRMKAVGLLITADMPGRHHVLRLTLAHRCSAPARRASDTAQSTPAASPAPPAAELLFLIDFSRQPGRLLLLCLRRHRLLAVLAGHRGTSAHSRVNQRRNGAQLSAARRRRIRSPLQWSRAVPQGRRDAPATPPRRVGAAAPGGRPGSAGVPRPP